jgi:hypothetical protein
MPNKQRGVFEKQPGSGVWWICYFDADGKRHREKVGRYTVAVDAYYQRKQEIREGRFQPPRRLAGPTNMTIDDRLEALEEYMRKRFDAIDESLERIRQALEKNV